MATKWSSFAAADSQGGPLEVVGLQGGANVRAGAAAVLTLIGAAPDDHEHDYEASGAVAAHAAAPDPHAGYLTAAEGNAAYEALGAVSDHAEEADPHPGYLRLVEADALYEPIGEAASAVAAHEAASDPHTGYQRESQRGAANGYASLDGDGKVPSTQLPAAQGFQYAIGDVVINVSGTNPAPLYGYGTWAAFGAGRVLVGFDSGDANFDAAEETGGAKTVTSTGSVSAPTFTGTALGTHSHGAGTLVPSAHSGAAVADHASHTHTYTDIVQHTHAVNITDGGHAHAYPSQTATTGAATSYEHGAIDTSSAEAAEGEVTASATTGITATTSNPAGSGASGTTAGPSATLTHNVTQPSAHTMSGSSEAVSGGTPAGINSAPTFTGNATSVVQPYITVYFWKRTA